MTSNDSTALFNNDNTTPTRRTSWKDDTDSFQLFTDLQNEKLISCPSANNTPDDSHATLYALTPRSEHESQLADIEAQEEHPTKPCLRHKAIAYTTLLCVIVTWLLLVAGVLLLTDNLLPTIMQLYHMLQNVKLDLANTEAAIDVLKVQMSQLSGYMDNQNTRMALNETIGGSVG